MLHQVWGIFMSETITIVGGRSLPPVSVDDNRRGFAPDLKAEVPVDSLADNLSGFLTKIGKVLETVPGTLGEFEIDTLTIDVEVTAEGAISLLGTGGKVTGKGGLTFTLKRPGASSQQGERS